jgi:putative transposase
MSAANGLSGSWPIGGWRGAYLRRGWQVTTRRGSAEPVKTTGTVPDLVQRDFTATRPNALWVADLTYVRTLQGFFYLAMVLDVFSRRLLGWMMGDTLRTELVLAALEMAIQRRDTAPTVAGQAGPEVIHHSDHGSQGGFRWS